MNNFRTYISPMKQDLPVKRGQEMHVSSEKKEEREVTIEKLEITLKNVKSYNYPAV